MSTTLLIGGARSGKSALALQIAAARGGPVTYIATAEARDEEMAARIKQHRAERASSWVTVEEPVTLAESIASVPDGHLLVVDCLTLWTSNLMERGFGDWEARAQAASTVCAARADPVVVITNEVGSGIVPANPLARTFRDALGAVNAIFARDAERVLFVSAGRALPLLRPEEALDVR